jgi:hypothetical protein
VECGSDARPLSRQTFQLCAAECAADGSANGVDVGLVADVLYDISELDLRDAELVEAFDDTFDSNQPGVGRDFSGDVTLQSREGTMNRRSTF